MSNVTLLRPSSRAKKIIASNCFWGVLFFLLLGMLPAASAAEQSPRERLLLDFGWKFHLGDDWGSAERLDKAGVNSGPAGHDFSDTSWRSVNLPHDWAPELPFDSNAPAEHGFKPVGPGYHSNDIGWYRRSFPLPESDAGRRLMIEFDGVFRDCTVFFNGYLIGHHESGYNGFRYDITDLANCGGRNTLAVCVDASQFESRFYEGAGIHRHVWLVKTSPLRVAPDGTFVYSQFLDNTPEGPATVCVQTFLNNAQGDTVHGALECEIKDLNGGIAAHFKKTFTLAPWASTADFQKTTVTRPVLWSPERPMLYTLVTRVICDGEITDRTETEFGIRTLAFDPARGFLLNNNPYEIKGACDPEDHAGVGSALPDRLQEFRINRLKEMGCNAIRTVNVPTPELLTACDRLGMLVMDDNRMLGSDAANLAHLEGQVCRDRNHPSVFLWSLFNEETRQLTPAAKRVTETMQRTVHQLDPSRLCTAGVNVGNISEGVNSIIDVRGWNYNLDAVDAYHKEHPDQPEIGTEQGGALSTREIYVEDKARGYDTAYDDNAPTYGATAEKWRTVFADRPWLSGAFISTGFDFRGDPAPFRWPCVSSHCGVLDTCGFAKDDFYYYQSWWSDRTVLHLLPHWTWKGRDGEVMDVRCFSNCEEVELFLNGTSLGRKPMPRNFHLQWTVKYTPGILLAKGYKDGQVVAERKVQTAGAPAAIKLTPDRTSISADGEDLSIIKVSVVDADGRTIPVADNLINFSLDGPGKIIGVGNGNPSCHEPDIYLPIQSSHILPLKDWRMTRIANPRGHPPEVAEDFDDKRWEKATVDGESGSLSAGETAVYRAAFRATPGLIAAAEVAINFGGIQEDGRLYVNGTQAGQSHDTIGQPSFEIRKHLHEGTNTIAVVVRNRGVSGGVIKGVALEIKDPPLPPQWKRSVFNGLAQIIVQAAKDPGMLVLTAKADGLAETTATITSSPGYTRPFVP